jgi:hypothetical protein
VSASSEPTATARIAGHSREFPDGAPAWWPMATAPKRRKVRPVLLRSHWNGHPAALVGIYRPAHGAWCTQDVFGQGEQIIHADAWAELPELGGSPQ